MKKHIQITCPECGREQRTKFKFGYQIVHCDDARSVGCGGHFAIDVDLNIEEQENETTLYYEAEAFRLVPAGETRTPEDSEMTNELLERLARIFYAGIKNKQNDH